MGFSCLKINDYLSVLFCIAVSSHYHFGTGDFPSGANFLDGVPTSSVLQDKPWTSGVENTCDMIVALHCMNIHLSSTRHGHHWFAVLQPTADNKELRKQTVKTWIFIIKCTWMAAIVLWSRPWTVFTMRFILWGSALDPLASWSRRHSVHSTCPQCLSSAAQTFNVLKESSHQTFRSANRSRPGSLWLLAF